MKILLTGYQGFIGQHLNEALKYHSLTLHEWGDRFPNLNNGYDWVLHIGAISSTAEKDVEKVLTQNFDFTIELYEKCKDRINFQWSSSASVYGFGKEFTETAKPEPQNPYAWSKYLIERHILKNLPVHTVAQGFRYFNVYGPEGEEHKGDQASPHYKFEQQARTTGVIKLFKNSENYLRDFVHVSKVVEVHKTFLDIKKSGIWNVGTGTPKSFEHVAKEIAKKYKARIEYIDMPENLKNHYQAYTCADLTKLLKDMND